MSGMAISQFNEIFLAIEPINCYVLMPDRTVGCGGVGRAKKKFGLERRLEAFLFPHKISSTATPEKMQNSLLPGVKPSSPDSSIKSSSIVYYSR
jgi:hypothetical protein